MKAYSLPSSFCNIETHFKFANDLRTLYYSIDSRLEPKNWMYLIKAAIRWKIAKPKINLALSRIVCSQNCSRSSFQKVIRRGNSRSERVFSFSVEILCRDYLEQNNNLILVSHLNIAKRIEFKIHFSSSISVARI